MTSSNAMKSTGFGGRRVTTQKSPDNKNTGLPSRPCWEGASGERSSLGHAAGVVESWGRARFLLEQEGDRDVQRTGSEPIRLGLL